MGEVITVQSLWTTPKGKKFQIITTPEQKRWRVYNLALHQYFAVGKNVEVIPGETKKDSNGNDYTEVFNVVLNGSAVLKTEKQDEPFRVIQGEPPKVEQKVAPQEVTPKTEVRQPDSKNRAFALSYAKDWAIACKNAGDKLKTPDILVVAKVFESYLDTGVIVEKKDSSRSSS